MSPTHLRQAAKYSSRLNPGYHLTDSHSITTRALYVAKNLKLALKTPYEARFDFYSSKSSCNLGRFLFFNPNVPSSSRATHMSLQLSFASVQLLFSFDFIVIFSVIKTWALALRHQ